MNGLKSSCRIRPNALGDWQVLPPPGDYLQIGDTGPALSVPLVGPDDLYVSGKCEVAVSSIFIGTTPGWNAVVCAADLDCSDNTRMQLMGANGELLWFTWYSEEIEVLSGSAFQWGAAGLAQADSILWSVTSRITQAPGGGATLVSFGRTGNRDEFLDDGPVTLGSTSNHAKDGDGVNQGPVYNDISRVLAVATNFNVTGASLKIRITVNYLKMYTPSS